MTLVALQFLVYVTKPVISRKDFQLTQGKKSKTSDEMRIASSIMEIIKEIKWEILTHAMSVSASLFVASKYSALPANHFTNLETLLMSV